MQDETLKLIQELKDDVEVTLDDLEFVRSKIDNGELENMFEIVSLLNTKIENIKQQKGDKGDNGLDGLDGKNGIDGKKGDTGDKGDNGLDGLDGSPDTPEEIVTKLNTLKNVLDKKVIKDLDFVEKSDLDRAISILDQRTQFLINSRTQSTSSVATWGSITGTLSDQTDLQTALNAKEDLINKSTTVTLGTSDTLYPTQNAVKTYVDNAVSSLGTVTSVDASGGTTGLTFSGGPVTTSGTLTLGGTLAIANGGTGTATGLPINNLIAATGTNTINNAAFAQVWQWNSLTTQTGLGLSSSSNTSGALLSLSSTSTAVTTNTGLLNVSYSGTPSTSSQTTYAIYANNNVVGNTGQTRYGVRGGVSGGTLFAGGGTGVGGLFSSSVTGTSGYGVQGTVSGQLASGAYGVYGSSTATSTAGAHGVYGISTGGGLGYGTYGSASGTSGTSYGSYGIATTTLNGGTSFGGRFRAVANTSGATSVSYGVYGEAVTTGPGGTAYGGYFSATEVSANNIAGYFTATGGTNNYGIIVANGSVGIGITAPTSVLDLRRTAGTGTQIPLFTAVGSAHTALTASTEYVDINFNLARTVQFATGAITTQRAMRVQAPTYGFVGASTITNATTFEISGAPVAGTNATITNPLALNVASGNASFGGNIIAAGTTSVIRLKGYTVATLPAGTQGDTAFVTDALAPTFLATIVGGGAVVTPVFYDGANWVGY